MQINLFIPQLEFQQIFNNSTELPKQQERTSARRHLLRSESGYDAQVVEKTTVLLWLDFCQRAGKAYTLM